MKQYLQLLFWILYFISVTISITHFLTGEPLNVEKKGIIKEVHSSWLIVDYPNEPSIKESISWKTVDLYEIGGTFTKNVPNSNLSDLQINLLLLNYLFSMLVTSFLILF